MTSNSAVMPVGLQELPDLWVALYPQQAFQLLRDKPQSTSGWQAVQRPLLVAFVIGCAMTLIASAPLHPWLMFSTTTYWSLVPLAEILGLLAAIQTTRNAIALPRLIDLYFTGHAPWLLWFVSLSIYWSFLSPARANQLVFIRVPGIVLLSVTVFVILWSIFIDLNFYRVVLGRTRMRACGELFLQRLVSWGIFIGVYTYGAFWEEIVRLVRS